MIKLPQPYGFDNQMRHSTYNADQLKQAIRDALEEAAKVCDAKAHEVRFWCNEANVIACAAAIRKLKEDTQ